MATVSTKPVTADEFFDFVHRPENAGRHFELERGEVIELPPPMKPHGFICGNVARILGNHAARGGDGYVCSNDTGLIVERDPDTVRGADLCYYVDNETLDNMPRKYSDSPPRLVVEVRSPTDREKKILRRLAEYLRLGVPMVWLVDPEDRFMSVHQPAQIPQVLDEADEVSGGEVLPGFTCRVSEFFARPGRAD
jgi:Uma2 family endonuclease